MDSEDTRIGRASSTEMAPQALSSRASSETVPVADGLIFGKKSVGSSPGKKAGCHLRQTRSGQVKMDSEEVGSGASLSRASSASLGFSFSFTGFTALPEDIVSDIRAFRGVENGKSSTATID